MNNPYILKRPLISEASLQDASQGVFTFEVARQANKHQIKQAVETLYGVEVVSVNTTTIPGKRYATGRRQRLIKMAAPSKKARVKLADGQKIDLFELNEAD